MEGEQTKGDTGACSSGKIWNLRLLKWLEMHVKLLTVIACTMRSISWGVAQNSVLAPISG